MRAFLFLIFASASLAAPLRVAIPAAGDITSFTEQQKLTACLSLYLHERFGELPGIELAAEDWTGAISRELTSGKRIRGDDDLWKSFTAYLPVDVLVSYQFVAGELEVSLSRSSGVVRRKFAAGAAKPVVLAVARWLAEQLALSPAATQVLVEDRIADPGVFLACYIVPRIVMDWPMNSGEKRLTLLHPFFPQNTNTLLAARVLESTYELFRSKSREQGYAKSAIALARLALPRVLGTPYELSAYSLLTNRPALFEADLLALADHVPDTATGELFEAAPVATKAQRLGALRCLGICQSQKGLALIQQAARENDPATREAAAVARQYFERTPPAPPPDVAARLDAITPAPVIAALRKLTPTAVERAKVLANDPFTPVAQAARLALTGFRPPAGREQTRFDLAVEHSYIRQKILDAHATDADLLQEACRNSDSHTQAHALRLLFKLAPDRARPLAQQALAGPYRWVRLQAAALLGTNDTDEVVGPPVHSLGQRNLAWLCGSGTDCENSPFDAYYNLKPGTTPALQRAYQQGKIVFARVTPVSHPGLVLTDPRYQDSFWLRLEQELTPENLACLDGVILGEETMSSDPQGLWPTGWPLFCHDAGIDPTTINGDREKLSPEQAKAWERWALTKFVAGFNVLYDYIKLRYGRLRPGFMVGTFMPGEGTVTPVDKEWKFDLGGIYDYKGCNRIAAYALVRRFKTMWPDRPVLWLSLGIGGYEMNPVKFSQKVPAQPIHSRSDRAYSDALSAWVAGADTGWFSIWMFTARKSAGPAASGIQVGVEEIYPASPLLKNGISYAFRGVAKEYLNREETGALKTAEVDLKDDVPVVELADDQPAPGEKFKGQVQAEMERMRRGFMFYGKYVYDNARVFSGLPRLAPKPTTLVIHPGLSVWSSSADFNSPGENLLTEFDYLPDLDQIAALDLARYRLIVINGPTNRPAALANWPGLLYVRGAPWPGGTTETLTPGLVVWRQPGWAGTVVFDSTAAVTDALRQLLKQTGPLRQQIGHVDQLTGAASSVGASDKCTYPGVDMLTGEPNPVVGGGRSGALVAGDYTGKYVASHNGVVVLCEKPVQLVEKTAGGLRIQSPGLIQAGAQSGAVRVTVAGGGQLPIIEKSADWILAGTEDGVATVPLGGTNAVATYIRSRQPLTIVAVPPP